MLWNTVFVQSRAGLPPHVHETRSIRQCFSFSLPAKPSSLSSLPVHYKRKYVLQTNVLHQSMLKLQHLLITHPDQYTYLDLQNLNVSSKRSLCTATFAVYLRSIQPIPELLQWVRFLETIIHKCIPPISILQLNTLVDFKSVWKHAGIICSADYGYLLFSVQVTDIERFKDVRN